MQAREKAEVKALRKTQMFKARRAPNFEKVWQKQARRPSSRFALTDRPRIDNNSLWPS
jgi:hypothetical protein